MEEIKEQEEMEEVKIPEKKRNSVIFLQMNNRQT